MNNRYKILVIEDEENIRTLMEALLDKNGYQVLLADTCMNGKMMFASYRPDLVILDLGLPDFDGMTFIKEIRKDDLTPIIVLSARTDEKDKVLALDMGANDYVTKPFSAEELSARVRSALRNARHSTSQGTLPGGKFSVRGLLIDYDARQVFIDGKEVKFTQTEYNIIALLSEYSGKVMTYAAIIRAIWGYNDLNSKKKLQVNMANIRKNSEINPAKKIILKMNLAWGTECAYKTRIKTRRTIYDSGSSFIFCYICTDVDIFQISQVYCDDFRCAIYCYETSSCGQNFWCHRLKRYFNDYRYHGYRGDVYRK